MTNVANKSNVSTPTNAEEVLPDDARSLRSSSEREKIVRKPLERSNSRNSPMRETPLNALKGIDFKKLFVKRNSLKPTQEREQKSPRNSFMQRNEQNRAERKRCPTPVPGIPRKTLEDRKNNPERQREAELQNDIFIAELQRNYYEEKEKREAVQIQLNVVGNKLKKTEERIEELEKELRLSQLREKEEKVKTSELSCLVDKKQSNLYEARSKLEKMKRQIKESRMEELTLENNKLRRQHSEITNKITVVEEENELLYGKCRLLDDQIYQLRKANEVLSQKACIASRLNYIDDLNATGFPSKNQRQQFLERVLHQREEECLQLRSIIDKLEIRINYMNRRSNETLEEFKTKKVGDLKNLRNTLSCIVKQNHNLKKETERLKKKITAVAAQQTGGRDPRINDDERIELKLSPDHSDT